MLPALGSLASWALPKLLTFASKKIFSTPLGQQVHKSLQSSGLSKLGKNIKNNYVKMMNNTYDN